MIWDWFLILLLHGDLPIKGWRCVCSAKSSDSRGSSFPLTEPTWTPRPVPSRMLASPLFSGTGPVLAENLLALYLVGGLRHKPQLPFKADRTVSLTLPSTGFPVWQERSGHRSRAEGEETTACRVGEALTLTWTHRITDSEPSKCHRTWSRFCRSCPSRTMPSFSR